MKPGIAPMMSWLVNCTNLATALHPTFNWILNFQIASLLLFVLNRIQFFETKFFEYFFSNPVFSNGFFYRKKFYENNFFNGNFFEKAQTVDERNPNREQNPLIFLRQNKTLFLK